MMFNKPDTIQRKKILALYIVLVLATLAVYWQVHEFDFINFDDNLLVYENPHISRISLDSLRWSFTTTYADLWSPFLWLSFLLDYQLYGLNAGGYHVTNLILHILSVWFLFWLVSRMTGALWPSAFVAAVFALHPLHVESVAWVTERKDVLSAFFWMLTLSLYVWYVEKPVIKRYLLVLFGFVCALMSKSMVVTLPAIMILLDYWPLNRFDTQKRKKNLILWQLKEKAPFFILSAFFSIMTFYIQYYLPSIRNDSSFKPSSLNLQLANAAVSFVNYIEKTFWPHDMAAFYPFPSQIPAPHIIGALLLIIIITVFVTARIKRMPYLFVGWMWFSITILPVIKILQIGKDAMADRYHYIPSIGISLMVAWGISSLIKKEFIRKNILFPSAVAVVVILAALTWNQCGYWKDSISVFNHALNVTKDNYVAHNHMGIALHTEGKIEDALYHYNYTLHINPNYPEAYNNRANVYATMGRYQSALEDFDKSIRLNPEYANTYNSRGIVYARLGQDRQALNDFSKAITLYPEHANAYHNRGINYARLNQLQLAINDFNKAISLKGDDADFHLCRGTVFLTQGNINLGCRDAQKACELGNCKFLELVKGEGYCR